LRTGQTLTMCAHIRRCHIMYAWQRQLGRRARREWGQRRENETSDDSDLDLTGSGRRCSSDGNGLHAVLYVLTGRNIDDLIVGLCCGEPVSVIH